MSSGEDGEEDLSVSMVVNVDAGKDYRKGLRRRKGEKVGERGGGGAACVDRRENGSKEMRGGKGGRGNWKEWF